MEASNRPAPTDLVAWFRQTPFAFDFFRAVRLLEARNASSARLGTSRHLREDFIRFGQNPSLAFAPSTLEDFRPGEGNRPAKIIVRFFGLFGPNGPLPQHLTEYAREQQLHAKSESLVEFCDMFHHRLLSLFYRAWAVNQKTVDFDRAERSVDEHLARAEAWSGPRFALYIGSFFGLGLESLRERDEIKDWAKLYYSGRLTPQTRNAEGLGAILQDYFGMRAEILSFFGQWLDLPPANVCRLGASPASGSLGTTAIVGSRFWDCQLKFRVRLGPVGLADLQRMLPIGSSYRQLKCWVKNYIGEELFWDVQLVLKAAEVPGISLGQTGLLGWTSWLKGAPFTRDADDVVLNPALV